MNEKQLTPQRLAEMIREGKRTAETRRQTKWFLEEIAAKLRSKVGEIEADVGTRAQSDSRNIQFLDRAYFLLESGWAVTSRVEPCLAVYVTPQELWWGLYAWGPEELAKGFRHELQKLGLLRADEEVVVATGGMMPSWTGGWYCASGTSLVPDTLSDMDDIESLTDRIAADLSDWYQRLSPHVRDIGQALDLKVTPKAWLFQANPQYFDLASATDVREIQAGSNDSWAVMRYGEEMQPGDSVVLWQSGNKAGIYALGYLTSSPYSKEVQATEEEIKERPYLEAKWWVDLQYTHILDRPVLRNEVKEHPTLADMQVVRAPQGTNFRLTSDEWKVIEELTVNPPHGLAAVEELVSSFFPETEVRRTCLEYYADCIDRAHTEAPANWGVTVLDDRIRLNVGSVVVMSLYKQKIWIATNQLSDAQRAQIGEYVTLTPEYDYASLKPVTTFYVAQEHVGAVRAVLQEGHFDFVSRAAATTMHRPSKDAHSVAFIHYLRGFLNRDIPEPAYRFSASLQRIVKIAPGHGAEFWDDCLANGYICVGWDEVGDLQQYETREAYETRFAEVFSDRYNDHAWTIQQKADEVWTLRELEPGDIVIANQGKSRVLAIGTVVGPGYEWMPQRTKYRHTVRVDWDTSYAQDIPTQSRWGFHTVLPVSDDLYQRILTKGPFVENVDVVKTLDNWLTQNGFYFTPWQIATFFTALQTKGFVILSGISGTGKSKLAQYFARAMPQPRFSAPAEYDDVINITVQPYMLRYNRFVIPKRALPLYGAPPAGESREITVQYGDDQNHCLLTHETSGVHYVVLYLRGRVTQWFKNTFVEGDMMIVEPLWTSETEFQGFHLQTEENYQVKNQTAVEEGQNWHFTPVRPDWRDSKSLLGYYNPLSGSYEWTPFLRFLLRVVRNYRREEGVAWFAILDEMNLAHVEYYFADLLSVLESGRDEEGWTREPLQLTYPEEAAGDVPPREIYLPPNLYVVGTVNVDETTHAFSPKVQDRAFTLELTEADFSQYPPDSSVDGDALPPSDITRQALLDVFGDGEQFVRIDKARIATFVTEHPHMRLWLQTLNERLRPFGFHFGYRVFDEIVTFLAHAEESEVYEHVLEHASDDTYAGLDALDLAFDAAVLMKVLPKLHGTRGQLEKPLKRMLAWCVDPAEPVDSSLTAEEMPVPLHHYRLPHTADRLQRMLQMLYTTGFAT